MLSNIINRNNWNNIEKPPIKQGIYIVACINQNKHWYGIARWNGEYFQGEYPIYHDAVKYWKSFVYLPNSITNTCPVNKN